MIFLDREALLKEVSRKLNIEQKAIDDITNAEFWYKNEHGFYYSSEEEAKLDENPVEIDEQEMIEYIRDYSKVEIELIKLVLATEDELEGDFITEE